MKNKAEMLCMIQTVKRLNNFISPANKSAEYLEGWESGKRAAVQMLLDYIEDTIEEQEEEF